MTIHGVAYLWLISVEMNNGEALPVYTWCGVYVEPHDASSEPEKVTCLKCAVIHARGKEGLLQ